MQLKFHVSNVTAGETLNSSLFNHWKKITQITFYERRVSAVILHGKWMQ